MGNPNQTKEPNVNKEESEQHAEKNPKGLIIRK